MKGTTLLRVMMAIALLSPAPALAQQADLSAFKPGPVFTEFGPHAPVEGASAVAVASNSTFSIAFDVKDIAADGQRNRNFESAARFINMHVAAGVPKDNIALAVVVHGKAVHDLIDTKARAARDMSENMSAGMVKTMLAHGVRFIVCGQSAAAYGVRKDELIAGVELELSAMTAHAQLQQSGYTFNPF